MWGSSAACWHRKPRQAAHAHAHARGFATLRPGAQGKGSQRLIAHALGCRLGDKVCCTTSSTGKLTLTHASATRVAEHVRSMQPEGGAARDSVWGLCLRTAMDQGFTRCLPVRCSWATMSVQRPALMVCVVVIDIMCALVSCAATDAPWDRYHLWRRNLCVR